MKFKTVILCLKLLACLIVQRSFDNLLYNFIVTLIQIWKSAYIIVLIWKLYAEDFTLKQFLLFEICTLEICDKFVHKHSETIEDVEN